MREIEELSEFEKGLLKEEIIKEWREKLKHEFNLRYKEYAELSEMLEEVKV